MHQVASHTTRSEKDLLPLLKKRDRAAYEYLYDKYSAPLYCLIRRNVEDDEIADEVLMNLFIHICSNIHEYDDEDGPLFKWMRKICMAHCNAKKA